MAEEKKTVEVNNIRLQQENAKLKIEIEELRKENERMKKQISKMEKCTTNTKTAEVLEGDMQSEGNKCTTNTKTAEVLEGDMQSEGNANLKRKRRNPRYQDNETTYRRNDRVLAFWKPNHRCYEAVIVETNETGYSVQYIEDDISVLSNYIKNIPEKK